MPSRDASLLGARQVDDHKLTLIGEDAKLNLLKSMNLNLILQHD